MDACGDEKLELSREQAARINEIYDSVYGMCKVLTENPDLQLDMYYIDDIADYAANLLYLLGNRVRYPAVVTGENGKQHVEEYHCEGGE